MAVNQHSLAAAISRLQTEACIIVVLRTGESRSGTIYNHNYRESGKERRE